jgi:tRNA threonylcarbamoyladenosine biosynthesis protein TsaB
LNLLALETSSDRCSAALWLNGRVVHRDERVGQRHSELILSMVDAVLAEAGVSLRGLDGVAFGAGPGSFTGLRIACGVAQGLAFGATLPVVGIGTLECLAEASGAQRVVACLDARIGDVYHAAFVREEDGRWRAVHPASVCRPETAPRLEGEGWAGVGNGFAAHGEALRARYAGQLLQVLPDLVPHAQEVAALGARALARGEGVSPEQAAPLYVRDKVALSIAERAALRESARARAEAEPG